MFLFGCGENPTGAGGQSDNNTTANSINVSVVNSNGIKLYYERLPLINVQQYEKLIEVQ